MLCSGVYGHEDYEVMAPLVLIHLPSAPVRQQGALYHCLPEELQAVLNVSMVNWSLCNIVIRCVVFIDT